MEKMTKNHIYHNFQKDLQAFGFEPFNDYFEVTCTLGDLSWRSLICDRRSLVKLDLFFVILLQRRNETKADFRSRRYYCNHDLKVPPNSITIFSQELRIVINCICVILKFELKEHVIFVRRQKPWHQINTTYLNQ